MEMRMHFKLNENKTQRVNIGGIQPQQCLQGNLQLSPTALEVNSLNGERAEVCNLSSYFKKLGKEEQTKCKASQIVMQFM